MQSQEFKTFSGSFNAHALLHRKFLPQRRKGAKEAPWKRGSALRLCAFAGKTLPKLNEDVTSANYLRLQSNKEGIE